MGNIIFKQQQQDVVKPKAQMVTSLSDAKQTAKKPVSTSSSPDISGSYLKPKYVEDKSILYKSSSYLADLIREED